MWINISKSGNSFMAGRACYGGEEASSRCIVREKTPTTIVLLFSFTGMCLSTTCRELAMRELRSEMKRKHAK